MIKAMLCETIAQTTDQYIDTFIEDDGWVSQPKLDGMRLVIETTEEGISTYNRNGETFTRRIAPRLHRDLRELPPGWILDGELVDGYQYNLFDVLRCPTALLTIEPLRKRISILEELHGKWGPGFVDLVPTCSTPFGKRNMLMSIREKGGEGIVFKELASTYQPGQRSKRWLKLKLWKSADCIVREVSPTGKSSVALALIHRGNDWPGEVVGMMKNGWQIVDVGSCLVRDSVLRRVETGMVMETKYLAASEGGKLMQPAFVRLRFDKEIHECCTDQLQYLTKRPSLT